MLLVMNALLICKVLQSNKLLFMGDKNPHKIHDHCHQVWKKWMTLTPNIYYFSILSLNIYEIANINYLLLSDQRDHANIYKPCLLNR